ncbi:MAG: hypothetical protein AAFY29_19805 [Pseudomonadota bacterium]
MQVKAVQLLEPRAWKADTTAAAVPGAKDDEAAQRHVTGQVVSVVLWGETARVLASACSHGHCLGFNPGFDVNSLTTSQSGKR